MPPHAFISVSPLSLRRRTFTSPCAPVYLAKWNRSRRLPRCALSAPRNANTEAIGSATNIDLHIWYRSIPANRLATAAARATFGNEAFIQEEACFVFELTHSPTDEEDEVLRWLFAETFEPDLLVERSKLGDNFVTPLIGPRLSFQTAWGANAVSVVRACGVQCVRRVERFRRYAVHSENVSKECMEAFVAAVHDRMTETVHTSLTALSTNVRPVPTREIDVMGYGEDALRSESVRMGLAFDDADVSYYADLFRGMGRNPTDVELFDLAQSNSEHSRHWFFNANLVLDGDKAPYTLMDVVREPLRVRRGNSVLAFEDNSSTIRGAETCVLRPTNVEQSAPLAETEVNLDLLCTAETHNFPCAVAPFPGAETGAGGRIRDSAATGTGSLVAAAAAGYAVGDLHLSGVSTPWERRDAGYPQRLASPLQILLEASDGASDYGNKFGEPVVTGFARTYATHSNGERREYVKPIMFSAGIGVMEHGHRKKGVAEKGLRVIKIGGPAYRIGVGGGAASSVEQGVHGAELDFNAVQRGDAQMEQRAYRVIRACVELGQHNPIVSLHDQGAGGNCNVVKELIYPEGARIRLRDVWIADTSLSALEIWGAEYQEQFGVLLREESLPLFRSICEREGVIATDIGTIDGSGRIALWDEAQNRTVVDMDLERVLGKLPRKTFTDNRVHRTTTPLVIPSEETVASALTRVLALMTVGSKRFVTTKVDRSVGGLVAQQQTVGALQLPLADAGVVARSHFSRSGIVTAIGERPALTTLSPAAMARVAVAEMLTNMCSVRVSDRSDIKCEANWMWAAKTPGDGADLYDAAVAMRDIMIDARIAVDGGKDSLSMAARCPVPDGDEQLVRAPGTLVVTGYCTVDDVTSKLTPDVKSPGQSHILHVDVANGKRRTGGSALAHVYGQLGDEAPDVDDNQKLCAAFDAVQAILDRDSVLSCHDISDGGLVVAALEMAFAGNCGLDLQFDSASLGVPMFAALFAEEVGLLLEVRKDDVKLILQTIEAAGVRCVDLGATTMEHIVRVSDGAQEVLNTGMSTLRDAWEATSFALDRLQATETCVDTERDGLAARQGLSYVVPYSIEATSRSVMSAPGKPRVAIVREEGSNGDREMAAAFHLAGFEAWDVSMSDLRTGHTSLSGFRGAAFVGGFSFADVLDSAKGWAGVAKFNAAVRTEMEAFFARSDTFSLGVCNGCQLLALLGRVPGGDGATSQPRFIRNASERYESRFVSVGIQNSNAIMLRGMQGARLGVWVAHGEGRAHFPDQRVLSRVLDAGLAPVRYVDDDGSVAEADCYPCNPNGSAYGIAALCSPDGRHLAMMPHPERAVLPWQWAYVDKNTPFPSDASPWLRMFQNAREWCEQS